MGNRFGRAAGWLYRRGGFDKFVHLASRGIEVGKDASKAIWPKRLPSSTLYYGRYEDGGIERFRELTDHMRAKDLNDARDAWDRDSHIYLRVAVAALIAIPVLILTGWYSVSTITCLLIMAIFLFIKALRADFSSWQIKQGRFGSLRDYLTDRLPANMQIIDKRDDQ